nr:LacI family DNA-binding transcriptional regulator [Devosia faecipullorum]
MSRRRSPTIKDVAKAAGVSSATVSYVLNGLNKVTPEVDALVRRVATEIGYSRNNAARALKTGHHHLIGCILPTLTSPVFPEIAQAVQRRAAQHGYATVVVDSGNEPMRELEVIETLGRHGIDGVVALLHPSFPLSTPPQLPMVSLDAPFPGLDGVMADHLTGGRLMAEHVIGLGHRKVGLLSGFQDHVSNKERREGFVQGAGSQLDLVWEVQVDLVPQLPDAAVAAIARRDVSVIVCVNDLVAIAALSALKSLGLRVPDDVSVIGFDDMQWSSWPLIGLTTIRQPLNVLGERAVDLLVDRISGVAMPVILERLPVELVVRTSTKAVP